MNVPDNISPKESKGLAQNEDRPLVSFILLAYNQERYIREAVEGALSQTYSPLEIILSDDCSTDRTFGIMQEMAAKYNGPHKVILNRNLKNLGLLKNLNECIKLSRGEIIVTSGGDDISLNYRVEKIINSGFHKIECAYVAFSDASVINEKSDLVSEYLYDRSSMYFSDKEKSFIVKDWKGENEQFFSSYPFGKISIHESVRGFLGATASYKRTIFSIFGYFMGENGAEDMILWYRCKLIGKYLFISEPLVKYRYRRNSLVPDSPKGITKKEYTIKVLSAFITRDINAIRDLKTAYENNIIKFNYYKTEKNNLKVQLVRNLFVLGCEKRNPISIIINLILLILKYKDFGWVLNATMPNIYKRLRSLKQFIKNAK